MISEKIFTKEGDVINDLFGNDVIVSSILPKSKTTILYTEGLLVYRFVPAGGEIAKVDVVVFE